MAAEDYFDFDFSIERDELEEGYPTPPRSRTGGYMTQKRKQGGDLFTDRESRVKFVQIIAVTYTYSDGTGEGSSVVALGDDGRVYQYRRGEINAWVPFSSEILRRD